MTTNLYSEIKGVLDLPDGTQVHIKFVMSNKDGHVEANIASKTRLYFSQLVQFIAYRDGKKVRMDTPGWNLSTLYQAMFVTNHWYFDGGYDPDTGKIANLPIYFRQKSQHGIPQSISGSSAQKLGKHLGLKHDVSFTNAFKDKPGPGAQDLKVYKEDYQNIDYLLMEFRTYLAVKEGNRLVPVARLYWNALTGYAKGADLCLKLRGWEEMSQNFGNLTIILSGEFHHATPLDSVYNFNPVIDTQISGQELKIFNDLQAEWIEKAASHKDIFQVQ
jgi:hypothetical protein